MLLAKLVNCGQLGIMDFDSVLSIASQNQGLSSIPVCMKKKYVNKNDTTSFIVFIVDVNVQSMPLENPTACSLINSDVLLLQCVSLSCFRVVLINFAHVLRKSLPCY